MTIFTNEELNEIRSKVDIVDIIGEYIPLVQKGKNFFGICPFHDDHNPSMSVSREKQIYTCFVCGASGNVYNFLTDYDNISFPEAVKKTASKAGIVLKNDINTYTKVVSNENYDIFDISTKYYQNNINTSIGKEAKGYLLKRKITDDIIKEFQIGLSIDQSDNLFKLLEGKKYSENKLISLGLINKSDYGYNDVFRNRIMFPIWDINGKVVGYSGRIYNTDDQAKYINTKESEIFVKGKLLYNYHRAKNDSRKKKQVILMEGFMDVIRAYSVGIKNVVATMGTALTKTQILLLKKLSNNIVICYDGDEAGGQATLSAINELSKANVNVSVMQLSDNLDPDDYIVKYGGNEFKNRLANALSILDFKMIYYKKGKDFSKNEDISKYIDEVINEIKNLDDNIIIELYIKKVSEDFSINKDLLYEKLSKVKPLPKKKETITRKAKLLLNKYQKAEQLLIYYMLRHKEVVRMYEVNVSYLPTSKYRILANEIIHYVNKYNDFSIADFITYLNDKEDLIKLIGELEQLSLEDDYTEEEINDYINVLKEFSIKNEIKRIKDKITEEIDPIKKAKLAEKIRKLKM
ncbi:MAG: DNA primase [Bacilli bacterium]